MIRVTYVLGCHDSRYSQHFEGTTMTAVQLQVDERMKRSYFAVEVADGEVRIYTAQVSAIEFRDLDAAEARLAAAQQKKEAQREGA